MTVGVFFYADFHYFLKFFVYKSMKLLTRIIIYRHNERIIC